MSDPSDRYYPPDEVLIARYGGGALGRAMRLAQNDVLSSRRDHDRLSGSVQDAKRNVTFRVSAVVSRRKLALSCTCPDGGDCVHALAVLLHARRHSEVLTPGPRDGVVFGPWEEVDQRPRKTSWQQALEKARQRRNQSNEPKTPLPPVQIGEKEVQPYRWRSELAGELERALPAGAGATSGEELGLCLGGGGSVRPVRRRSGGQWSFDRAGWRDLMQDEWESVTVDLDPIQLSIVRGIGRLMRRAGAGSDSYDTLVQHALRSGLTLVTTAPGSGELVELELSNELADVHFDIQDTGEQLRLSAVVTIGDERIRTEHIGAFGNNYIFDRASRRLALWSPRAMPRSHALRFSQIEIPAAETAAFVRDFLPQLRQLAPVVSSDDSFLLPQLTFGIDICADLVSSALVQIEVYGVRDNGFERLRAGSLDAQERAAVREIQGRLHQIFGGSRDSKLVGVEHFYQQLEQLEAAFNADETVRLVLRLPRSARATNLRLDFQVSPDAGRRDWFEVGANLVVDDVEIPAEQWRKIFKNHGTMQLGEHEYYFDAKLRGALRQILDRQQINHGQIHAGLTQLEDLIPEDDQLETSFSGQELYQRFAADFSARLPELVAPQEIELRGYQEHGIKWLTTVILAGCGGILADEMGLGKTVQLLAAISATRAEDTKPVLIVAPTSVVSVWLEQAERFFPQLRTAAVRSKADPWDRPVDLLITSYAMVRSQFERAAEIHWSGLILDEAQAVKNPATRIHQRLTQLQRQWCIAVTGTPIENSITDLWAIMRITNARALPARKRFEAIAATDVNRVDELVGPLVLRRTKDQVALDLPAKTEQTLAVELGPKHAAIYRELARREAAAMQAYLKDPQANRTTILAALTRLRRTALDARLLDGAAPGIGAKNEYLIEAVKELSGHQVLVFSQFTSYLKLLRKDLEEAGISTVYLDGATRARPAVIAAFKEQKAQVFLISLKAGGTGLTLTEADYVFIMDPWWNPAVENQAIDRTHRLGQTRPVTVYRLVAAGTVEEKVLDLQAQKRDLFKTVMSGARLSDATLTQVVASLR